MKYSGAFKKLLWLEFLDDFATFLIDFQLVLYLTQDFRIIDELAGWLYASVGCLVIVYGILLGFIIDFWGIQTTLVVGTSLSIVGRIALIAARNYTTVVICLLTICPATAALTSPVIKLAVRRYVPDGEREKAFRLIYIVINIACILSAIAIGVARFWFNQHCSWSPFGVVCNTILSRMFPSLFSSYFRVALLFCVVAGFIQLAVAVSLKRTPALTQIETSSSLSLWESLYGIYNVPNVRCCFLIGVIIASGSGAIMRHYGATFPKYFTREFGNDAPYELVLVQNPIIILICLSILLLINHQLDFKLNVVPSLLIGTSISTLSMLVLAVETSMRACFLSVVLFTIGETLWSPKMMEISVMAGNEGREGTAIAVASLPKFLSRVVAGSVSGYLLAAFCPEEGYRRPNMLWLIIGLMASATPVMLLLFKARIFTPEFLRVVDGFEEEKKVKLDTERMAIKMIIDDATRVIQ